MVTDPVSMGTPQFHISSPVAITIPGITSFPPNPGLCATLPAPLSPTPFSCLGNKGRVEDTLLAPMRSGGGPSTKEAIPPSFFLFQEGKLRQEKAYDPPKVLEGAEGLTTIP